MKASSGGRSRTLATVAVVCAACVPLADCGILGDLRFNPGYASFGSPGSRDTDRDFALSLGPLPLKLARVVMKHDPEMASMLVGVKAVRVYTYEVGGDRERVRERMDGVRARLRQQGWDQIVAVRDDGELVSALVRIGKPNTIQGLAVIVQDDTDLTLVNVIGDIRPESFGAMMAAVGIDIPKLSIEGREPAGAPAGPSRASDRLTSR